MENVGEKIYNLRKEKGVSQEELAFALKTSRQTVSRWENNSVSPTFTNLESLCKYFNVSNDYFFCGAETKSDKEEKASAQNAAVSNNNRKLIVFVAAVALLALCVIACCFAGYVTISPADIDGLNIRIVNRFKYVGIVCVIIGAIAFAMQITLIAVFIKDKRKSKRNTHFGKM